MGEEQKKEQSPLNPEFSSRKLNELGLQRYYEIQNRFNDLLNQLMLICPPGREFAIVKTKLEEASFFAQKASSLNTLHQYDQTPAVDG